MEPRSQPPAALILAPICRKTFAFNKNVVDIKILIGPAFRSVVLSLLKNFQLREGQFALKLVY
jgi:hypothetical protein